MKLYNECFSKFVHIKLNLNFANPQNINLLAENPDINSTLVRQIFNVNLDKLPFNSNIKLMDSKQVLSNVIMLIQNAEMIIKDDCFKYL
jgi:hypothetical protein